MKLTIGWLYPKQMSTYGDRGNVLTLRQRCLWRNIEVEIIEIDLKEKINPKRIDLFFFGGGQDRAQFAVSRDLQKFKTNFLKESVDLEAVFLSVCGGYQLLGNYYKAPTGEELPGVGLLDIFTIAGDQRMIGNILVESNVSIPGKTLVGFENHSGKTFIGKKAVQLGRVVVGYGNNSEDRTEGAIQGNVFGSYLHGPLLPKNLAFADYLIEKALRRKNSSFELKKLKDDFEIAAHQLSVKRSRETE